MLTNAQMKEGRFLKLQRGKRTMAALNAIWDNGGAVVLCTYTKAAVFKAKNRDMVKMLKSGEVVVQSGKNWLSTLGAQWRNA